MDVMDNYAPCRCCFGQVRRGTLKTLPSAVSNPLVARTFRDLARRLLCPPETPKSFACPPCLTMKCPSPREESGPITGHLPTCSTVRLAPTLHAKWTRQSA